MQCPACGRALERMTVADVTVDVCRGGCGGIWFDARELGKLDDRDEAAGEALLDVERDPAVTVDHDAQWGCPRCGHPAMTRHFYSPKRAVEVDECPKCAGVWLDAGELATIRAQYAGADERRQAHLAFARQLYDEQLAQIQAADAAESSAADLGGPLEMVTRLFRFL